MNELLAFRRVVGKNAGENKAQIVLSVLEEVEIQGHCLVGDNGASNDTAVSAILKVLHQLSPRSIDQPFESSAWVTSSISVPML